MAPFEEGQRHTAGHAVRDGAAQVSRQGLRIQGIIARELQQVRELLIGELNRLLQDLIDPLQHRFNWTQVVQLFVHTRHSRIIVPSRTGIEMEPKCILQIDKSPIVEESRLYGYVPNG